MKSRAPTAEGLRNPSALFLRTWSIAFRVLLVLLVPTFAGLLIQQESASSARQMWRPAAGTSVFRAHFPATVLPNGNVLAAAGFQGLYSEVNAEVYDPQHDRWFPTGNMSAPERIAPTATLLPDGDVLVAGGGLRHGRSQPTAELYDANTNSWSRADDMTQRRSDHSAVLLPDGKVLLVGGFDCNFVYGCDSLASIEVYDPASRTWSAGADMDQARGGHTASLLPNGRVLVTGGFHCLSGEQGGSCTVLASSEVYDPATDSWSSAAPLSEGRGVHSAAVLANGNVIVIGGNDGKGVGQRLSEIYDYRSGEWSSGGLMNYGRIDHATTSIPNGKVLVSGGFETQATFTSPLGSAELYDPKANTWTMIDPMITPRRGHAAALLQNGEVLVAGGFEGGAELLSPGITHAR
jgi:trimeric autotransporter adhesin